MTACLARLRAPAQLVSPSHRCRGLVAVIRAIRDVDRWGGPRGVPPDHHGDVQAAVEVTTSRCREAGD